MTAGDTAAPDPFPVAAEPSVWARPDAYQTDAFAPPQGSDQFPAWNASAGAAPSPAYSGAEPTLPAVDTSAAGGEVVPQAYGDTAPTHPGVHAGIRPAAAEPGNGVGTTAEQQPLWAQPAAAPAAYQPPDYQAPGGFAAPVPPPQTSGSAFGYPPSYPYGPPGYPYGYPTHRPTDGMAIASLVVACVGLLGLCAYGLGGVLGIVGAVLGHVARHRIRRSGADGGAMALAGIIVGWAVVGISVLVVALVIGLILTDRTIWNGPTE